MPIAYVCKHSGCSNLVETKGTFCMEHKHLQEEEEQRKKEFFFKNARKPNKELYNTSQWRALRQEILIEQPACVICNSTEHLQVHHIQPPKGNPTLFYDRNNLSVVCEICHRKITHLEVMESRSKHWL